MLNGNLTKMLCLSFNKRLRNETQPKTIPEKNVVTHASCPMLKAIASKFFRIIPIMEDGSIDAEEKITVDE